MNTSTLFLLAEGTTISMTAVTSPRLHHNLHEETRWFMLYLKLNRHKSCRIKQQQKSHQQMRLHQIPPPELSTFNNNSPASAMSAVFTADPGELGLPPEVRWVQGGEPAALAGVRPKTPPPVQLGPELLPVGRVVSAQRWRMVDCWRFH